MTFPFFLCSRDFLKVRVVNLQNSLQLEEPHPKCSCGPLASLKLSSALAMIYWGRISNAETA